MKITEKAKMQDIVDTLEIAILDIKKLMYEVVEKHEIVEVLDNAMASIGIHITHIQGIMHQCNECGKRLPFTWKEDLCISCNCNKARGELNDVA